MYAYSPWKVQMLKELPLLFFSISMADLTHNDNNKVLFGNTINKMRFHQKKRKQTRHNKRVLVSLIVFGSRMFRKDLIKLKESRCVVNSAFCRSLEEKERSNWQLQLMYTKHQKFARRNDPLTSMPDFKGCIILVCNIYKILWQQDIKIYKNIPSSSLSIWDEREPIFQHKRK